MSAHSIIAPSSAGRWGSCPGSARLEAKYPQEPTQDTLEGEASHFIGSEILGGLGTPANCADFMGLTVPNGVVVDRDMVDSAAIYVATILAIAPHVELCVEKSVRIARVNSECFGTPDCWYYDRKGGVLHIWDYKYGWGIVSAFENKQAISYYAGIIEELGIPDLHLQVVIHVVQPRPYHPDGPARKWETLATNLRPLVNQLHNSAAEALSPEPRYCSGYHCRYCKGRHACLSADQAATFSVDVAGTAIPHELNNEEIGIELAILRRAAKALDYRITGLEAQGLELARRGTVIPGQRIDHGAGSTVWTKPVREVLALGDLMGADLRKPESAITPKQAEAKGMDPALLKSYSMHKSGKARLIADDNTKARQIFGGSTT